MLRFVSFRFPIIFQFPDFNLVVEQGGHGNEYPIEVLTVADCQRVVTQHQTPEVVQKMIRACAVPPVTLMNQNKRNAQALGLCGSNRSPYLEAVGVRVMDEPVQVQSRVLPTPYIVYSNEQIARPDSSRGVWNQRQHYLIPASLDRWAFYILGEPHPGTFGPHQVGFVNYSEM